MDEKRFDLCLNNREYLMGDTDCYIPGKSGYCSCNRYERYLLPECKGCLEHFDKLEGAPVPEIIKSAPCWKPFRRFNTWKAIQAIELRRLTEEYTEEQAEIVMEEFIKSQTVSCRVPNLEQQRSQQALAKLFG